MASETLLRKYRSVFRETLQDSETSRSHLLKVRCSKSAAGSNCPPGISHSHEKGLPRTFLDYCWNTAIVRNFEADEPWSTAHELHKSGQYQMRKTSLLTAWQIDSSRKHNTTYILQVRRNNVELVSHTAEEIARGSRSRITKLSVLLVSVIGCVCGLFKQLLRNKVWRSITAFDCLNNWLPAQGYMFKLGRFAKLFHPTPSELGGP